MQGDLIMMDNGYSVKFLAFSNEFRKVGSQFCLIFQNAFLPDKRIFVSIGLYLGSVNKDNLPGYLTKVKEHSGHGSQDGFMALGKMKRTKPCNRCMVRGRRSFKKIHEVHITAAGCFNGTAGIDVIHVRINQNFQHLTRCRLIFPYPLISRIQISELQPLHESAQKAYRVISGNVMTDINGKL